MAATAPGFLDLAGAVPVHLNSPHATVCKTSCVAQHFYSQAFVNGLSPTARRSGSGPTACHPLTGDILERNSVPEVTESRVWGGTQAQATAEPPELGPPASQGHTPSGWRELSSAPPFCNWEAGGHQALQGNEELGSRFKAGDDNSCSLGPTLCACQDSF